MENWLRYLVENPVMAAIIVVSAAVVVYFILKKILKYAIISLVVFIALSGYSYYKAPDEFSEKFKTNIAEIHERGGDIVDKGRQALEQRGGIGGVLDRVVEKGRELFSDRDEK
ncbi:MAG: hypothetical protein AVO39_08700 [delta proteobacterium MLS_D]|jgi:hypothetical protein|nr:MAG: hypothetical protein AVO39_08700 [delta proteobacterium MLS_D]